MKLLVIMLFMSGATLLSSPNSQADDEFRGTVESRPQGKVGTWVIDGRQFEVTERTHLDEDDGPLVIGACAEVEYERDFVEEIESEEKHECENRSTPSHP